MTVDQSLRHNWWPYNHDRFCEKSTFAVSRYEHLADLLIYTTVDDLCKSIQEAKLSLGLPTVRLTADYLVIIDCC